MKSFEFKHLHEHRDLITELAMSSLRSFVKKNAINCVSGVVLYLHCVEWTCLALKKRL